jgi:hypothetical protein
MHVGPSPAADACNTYDEPAGGSLDKLRLLVWLLDWVLDASSLALIIIFSDFLSAHFNNVSAHFNNDIMETNAMIISSLAVLIYSINDATHLPCNSKDHKDH